MEWHCRGSLSEELLSYGFDAANGSNRYYKHRFLCLILKLVWIEIIRWKFTDLQLAAGYDVCATATCRSRPNAIQLKSFGFGLFEQLTMGRHNWIVRICALVAEQVLE